MGFLATACQNQIELAEERPIAVEIKIAELGELTNYISFIGRTRASENIAVIGRLPGMVEEVFFDVGDFVNAGDILFTMDAIDIQNNIDALVSQLAVADAAVSAAQTGVAQASGAGLRQQILAAEGAVNAALSAVRQTETGLTQTELGMAQAEIALSDAVSNHNDVSALFEAGIAPRAQMDQAETILNSANIGREQAENAQILAQIAHEQSLDALNQANDALDLARNAAPGEILRRAEDAVRQAVAQRDSLQTSLSAARERLDDAIVRAPISGVITSRSVNAQTMLTSVAPPFTISGEDSILAVADVTETLINSITPGLIINVYISAISETPFEAEIALVSPGANHAGLFTIEATIKQSDSRIRPGMIANLVFPIDIAEGVIIPRSAVVIESGRTVVYAFENGRAHRREVFVLLDNGENAAIGEGLREGEALIIKGQNFVTDGSAAILVN